MDIYKHMMMDLVLKRLDTLFCQGYPVAFSPYPPGGLIQLYRKSYDGGGLSVRQTRPVKMSAELLQCNIAKYLYTKSTLTSKTFEGKEVLVSKVCNSLFL